MLNFFLFFIFNQISFSACQTCSSTWLTLNGSTYKMENTSYDLGNAQSSCQRDGAQLAIIYDQNSHDAMWALSGDIERWIGLSNPNDIDCRSGSACSGMKIWMDGKGYTYGTWFKFSMDIQPGDTSARIQTDTKKNINGINLGGSKASLCQFLGGLCVDPPASINSAIKRFTNLKDNCAT